MNLEKTYMALESHKYNRMFNPLGSGSTDVSVFTEKNENTKVGPEFRHHPDWGGRLSGSAHPLRSPLARKSATNAAPEEAE